VCRICLTTRNLYAQIAQDLWHPLEQSRVEIQHLRMESNPEYLLKHDPVISLYRAVHDIALHGSHLFSLAVGFTAFHDRSIPRAISTSCEKKATVALTATSGSSCSDECFGAVEISFAFK